MSVTTSGLTRGEKLLIARRRAGHTVAKEAKSRKVTLTVYRGWEKDEGEGAPDTKCGKLTEGESCFLRRRRAGMTLAQLATKLDVCRWWVHQMENDKAPINALRKYWSKRAA